MPTASSVRIWVVLMLAASLLFSLQPRIDLAVSRLFFDGQVFVPAEVAALEWLRQGIWRLSEAMIAIAALGFVLGWATQRRALWLPQHVWGFILALYVIGPGLLVNLGLKSHWGRARPANVIEFGGTAHFTPALRHADECLRNCSFVSGEASSAAALAISAVVALVTLRGRMSPRAFRTGLWLAAAVAIVGGVLRVAAGRHFVSDVVFAWLLTAGVALLLRAVLLRQAPARVPELRHR